LGNKEVEAKFDKIVMMVVDAMRADFVYGPSKEEHPFAFVREHLIKGNRSIPLLARASTPTVTLPRVKVRNDSV
jgi:ethanolaminephosphotransferase